MSSAKQWPDRKTFIGTLAGTAFVVGLTGASIYQIRNARAVSLKQAQEALTNGIATAPRPTSILTKSSTSVFDDASNSSLPRVLQRKCAPLTQPAIANTTPANLDHSEMDSTLDFLGLSTPSDPPTSEQEDYNPKGFWDTPVGLSLKAFGIATGLVCGGAFLVIQGSRRFLRVESIDQFVTKMAEIVPSRQFGSQILSLSFRTTSNTVEEGEIEPPLSIDQAMTQLGQSTTLEDWFRTLKRQLDAERNAQASTRLPSSKTENEATSPSFDIHSTLEHQYTIGISPLLPSVAFGLGFASGVATAGKKTGLVFMAENAHRLPDTVQGWYFYSKTKNYRVLLGALKGGIKSGARMSAWTGGFCVAQRVAEVSRLSVLGDRRMHWVDGAFAGLLTAGAAVGLYRLTRTPAIRAVQLGIVLGGLTGGLRDAQQHLLQKDIDHVASHT